MKPDQDDIFADRDNPNFGPRLVGAIVAVVLVIFVIALILAA